MLKMLEINFGLLVEKKQRRARVKQTGLLEPPEVKTLWRWGWGWGCITTGTARSAGDLTVSKQIIKISV